MKRSLDRVVEVGESTMHASPGAMPLALIGMSNVFGGDVRMGTTQLEEALLLMEGRQTRSDLPSPGCAASLRELRRVQEGGCCRRTGDGTSRRERPHRAARRAHRAIHGSLDGGRPRRRRSARRGASSNWRTPGRPRAWSRARGSSGTRSTARASTPRRGTCQARIGRLGPGRSQGSGGRPCSRGSARPWRPSARRRRRRLGGGTGDRPLDRQPSAKRGSWQSAPRRRSRAAISTGRDRTPRRRSAS